MKSGTDVGWILDRINCFGHHMSYDAYDNAHDVVKKTICNIFCSFVVVSVDFVAFGVCFAVYICFHHQVNRMFLLFVLVLVGSVVVVVLEIVVVEVVVVIVVFGVI
jgi:hypothetical protein